MNKIILKAFGKINLTLDVLNKCEDNYHELETFYRGINLYDLITIERQERGICLVCNDKELCPETENLAYRAACVLQKDFTQIKGVSIKLTKRIPVAAGLAGGSADAATVLVGLNLLYNLNLTKDQLAAYAAKLGSDVPFCLYPLASIGRGKGEIIADAPAGPTLWMVLIKPPFGLLTKDVYNHIDNVDILKRPNLAKVIQGMSKANLDLVYQNMGNVLEYAAFDLQPKLAKWQKEISTLQAQRVMMSGSGPTLIAFFSDEQKARNMAAYWTRPRWEVLLSCTLLKEELDNRIILAKTIDG